MCAAVHQSVTSAQSISTADLDGDGRAVDGHSEGSTGREDTKIDSIRDGTFAEGSTIDEGASVAVGERERHVLSIGSHEFTRGCEGESNAGGRVAWDEDEVSAFLNNDSCLAVEGTDEFEGLHGSAGSRVGGGCRSNGGDAGYCAGRRGGVRVVGGCVGDVDGDIVDNDDRGVGEVGDHGVRDHGGIHVPIFLPAAKLLAIVLDINVDNLAVHKVPVLIWASILYFARRVEIDPLRGFDLAAALLVVAWRGTVGGGRIRGCRGGRDDLGPCRDGAWSAYAAGGNDSRDGRTVIDGGVRRDSHPFGNDVRFGAGGGGNVSKRWGGQDRQGRS